MKGRAVLVLRLGALPGLSAAGVVALEDRQQVAQVGFRAQFFDQADVGPNPVVFADEWLMGQRESFAVGSVRAVPGLPRPRADDRPDGGMRGAISEAVMAAPR